MMSITWKIKKFPGFPEKALYCPAVAEQFNGIIIKAGLSIDCGNVVRG